LHQPIAVGGIAGLTVGRVEHEIKGAEHKVAHARVCETMIFREQNAIFRNNERVIAVAVAVHPLAKVAYLLSKGIEIVMRVQGRRTRDPFMDIFI
jgi:hypothetical protein